MRTKTIKIVSISMIKNRRDALIKMVGEKIALLLAVAAASVVGGLTTAGVMAAIPNNSGKIQACYDNTSGNARIIDDSTATCGSTETALAWDQTAPKLKYAVNTSELSLTPEQSVALGDSADLGGPDLTVTVPNIAGTFVRINASAEIKGNCEIASTATIIDETTGDTFVDNMGEGGLQIIALGPFENYTVHSMGGASSPAGRGINIPASAGTHTYGVRYKVSPYGATATCAGMFKNTKLWAEVVTPS